MSNSYLMKYEIPEFKGDGDYMSVKQYFNIITNLNKNLKDSTKGFEDPGLKSLKSKYGKLIQYLIQLLKKLKSNSKNYSESPMHPHDTRLAILGYLSIESTGSETNPQEQDVIISNTRSIDFESDISQINLTRRYRNNTLIKTVTNKLKEALEIEEIVEYRTSSCRIGLSLSMDSYPDMILKTTEILKDMNATDIEINTNSTFSVSFSYNHEFKLTLRNKLAIWKTKLIDAYSKIDTGLDRLVILMQGYMAQCPHLRILSTFALQVLLIYYLQQISVLPVLQERSSKPYFVNGVNLGFHTDIDNYQVRNSSEENLIGVFEYYAQVKCRNRIDISKREQVPNGDDVWIQHPGVPDKNLMKGNVATAVMTKEIKAILHKHF